MEPLLGRVPHLTNIASRNLYKSSVRLLPINSNDSSGLGLLCFRGNAQVQYRHQHQPLWAPGNHMLQVYQYSTTTTTPNITTALPKTKKKGGSFLDKVRLWLNIEKKPPKSLLRSIGYLWYVKIADEIDFGAFYKTCNLPDTFASWFTVIELHVWLLSTRLMEEPNTGKIVRNSLIRAMWEDIEVRSKKLEGALAAARREQIKELNEQFQASLIGYDEGLLAKSDTVLAGALWRKFLRPYTLPGETEHEKPDPTRSILTEVIALELLLSYVRSEHCDLQQLTREQILFKRDYKWKPFNHHLVELQRFQS